MARGWLTSSGIHANGSRFLTGLSVALLSLVAGCGTVAVHVDGPVGTHVQMYEKDKWFGGFGPDWGTGWSEALHQTVEPGGACVMEFDAKDGWYDAAVTYFPREYRLCFDLSDIVTYPETPSSMVEVRYKREVVPPKYQEVIRLWHAGRTLDVLTHVPPDVLADVLYNLGDKFKRLLGEVPAETQKRAAMGLKALLEAEEAPGPAELESWLKSLLTKEQLDQVCDWVRDGVTLTNVRWVRLGGEPREEGVPVFWRFVQSFVDVFVRQPEIRSTHVNFFEDVILRNLMVMKLETKLVNVGLLKFYAEVLTFDTTYFSDRVAPTLDLVQDIGLAEIVRPSEAEEAELARFGMTRSTRLSAEARAEAIRNGLPPVALKSTTVTAIRSQLLGALLENEMAYVVIWNNPREADPVRFLTTVVTPGPYGMARVWALRGNDELCHGVMPFQKQAPLAELASMVGAELQKGAELFVRLDKPVAVFAFGRRRLAPWTELPRDTASFLKPMHELEPGADEDEE